MCEDLIFLVQGDYIERESFNVIFLIVIVINENVFHDFIALITILFVTVSLWQKKARTGRAKNVGMCRTLRDYK